MDVSVVDAGLKLRSRRRSQGHRVRLAFRRSSVSSSPVGVSTPRVGPRTSDVVTGQPPVDNASTTRVPPARRPGPPRTARPRAMGVIQRRISIRRAVLARSHRSHYRSYAAGLSESVRRRPSPSPASSILDRRGALRPSSTSDLAGLLPASPANQRYRVRIFSLPSDRPGLPNGWMLGRFSVRSIAACRVGRKGRAPRVQ